MGRLAQHLDVGASAKDPVLGRSNDHRSDLRVLEPQTLHCVIKLDIHAQIIGIELEVVTGNEGLVFLDVQTQPRNPTVYAQPPVFVLAGAGGEVHENAGLLACCGA